VPFICFLLHLPDIRDDIACQNLKSSLAKFVAEHFGPHLEIFERLLQSCFTLFEECIQFSLAEEHFDLTPILLGFNKSMYLLQCSE
jgi:hypothetical protein